MKAGPELDELIAEKVMGWRVVHHKILGAIFYTKDENSIFPYEFEPSRRISDTWSVVEKLKPKYMFKLTESLEGYWWAEFDADISVYHESASLAICLAALRAVGEEI